MVMNLFDLTGRNALVVGGHGGIGRAIAEAFADYGADVSIASRNMEKLLEAKEYIKEKYSLVVISVTTFNKLYMTNVTYCDKVLDICNMWTW